ncbi:unnamed protein product [Nesidiocoris tenuis]|uniref:Uncharacterized protein n=1 Tax=Nesidiocoris tenuis TaxID=355587 RepID=A0A6H5G1V7_9HEMI|nr:unnamed protein product [Nesidiocoris tenuis]
MRRRRRRMMRRKRRRRMRKKMMRRRRRTRRKRRRLMRKRRRMRSDGFWLIASILISIAPASLWYINVKSVLSGFPRSVFGICTNAKTKIICSYKRRGMFLNFFQQNPSGGSGARGNEISVSLDMASGFINNAVPRQATEKEITIAERLRLVTGH